MDYETDPDFEIIIDGQNVANTTKKPEKSIEPPVSSERIKAQELAKLVRQHFSQLATTTEEELDYLKAHYGTYLYGAPEGIEWMFEYEKVTINELIADLDSPERNQALRKRLLSLNQLRQKLDQLPDRDGYAAIAIKKMREKDGHVSGYQVLARYPSEAFVVHYGIDKTAGGTSNDKRDHVVFYQTSNACLAHACHELYATLPENSGGKVGYLPIVEIYQAVAALLQKNGIAEYVMEDEHGNKVTQDNVNYLNAALLGGLSNETDRIRISDLWKRKNKNS
jgi:hypothetical protein